MTHLMNNTIFFQPKYRMLRSLCCKPIDEISSAEEEAVQPKKKKLPEIKSSRVLNICTKSKTLLKDDKLWDYVQNIAKPFRTMRLRYEIFGYLVKEIFILHKERAQLVYDFCKKIYREVLMYTYGRKHYKLIVVKKIDGETKKRGQLELRLPNVADTLEKRTTSIGVRSDLLDPSDQFQQLILATEQRVTQKVDIPTSPDLGPIIIETRAEVHAPPEESFLKLKQDDGNILAGVDPTTEQPWTSNEAFQRPKGNVHDVSALSLNLDHIHVLRDETIPIKERSTKDQEAFPIIGYTSVPGETRREVVSSPEGGPNVIVVQVQVHDPPREIAQLDVSIREVAIVRADNGLPTTPAVRRFEFDEMGQPSTGRRQIRIEQEKVARHVEHPQSTNLDEIVCVREDVRHRIPEVMATDAEEKKKEQIHIEQEKVASHVEHPRSTLDELFVRVEEDIHHRTTEVAETDAEEKTREEIRTKQGVTRPVEHSRSSLDEIVHAEKNVHHRILEMVVADVEEKPTNERPVTDEKVQIDESHNLSWLMKRLKGAKETSRTLVETDTSDDESARKRKTPQKKWKKPIRYTKRGMKMMMGRRRALLKKYAKPPMSAAEKYMEERENILKPARMISDKNDPDVYDIWEASSLNYVDVLKADSFRKAKNRFTLTQLAPLSIGFIFEKLNIFHEGPMNDQQIADRKLAEKAMWIWSNFPVTPTSSVLKLNALCPPLTAPERSSFLQPSKRLGSERFAFSAEREKFSHGIAPISTSTIIPKKSSVVPEHERVRTSELHAVGQDQFLFGTRAAEIEKEDQDRIVTVPRPSEVITSLHKHFVPEHSVEGVLLPESMIAGHDQSLIGTKTAEDVQQKEHQSNRPEVAPDGPIPMSILENSREQILQTDPTVDAGKGILPLEEIPAEVTTVGPLITIEHNLPERFGEETRTTMREEDEEESAPSHQQRVKFRDVILNLSVTLAEKGGGPITFNDLCPKTFTSRREAAKSFAVLLELHAQKRILLKNEIEGVSSSDIKIYLSRMEDQND